MTEKERGAGTQFSRYVVTKRLDRSWPHFSFYEALQEGLDRLVELRVFSLPPTDTEGALARFEREYKTLCKLDHPNILKILDLGVANGSPYYITDLRSSCSVAALLAREAEPLSCEMVLGLGCQICSALAYLHERSILHRNLSTDSIFWEEENNFFYIGEFSMGKDQSLDDITDLGIPELYPLIETPESQEGKEHDERSDLFLLGRVLYQALTLKVPEVRTGSLLLSSWSEAQKLGISQYNADVPPGVEEIVLRTLDETPENRFSSAAELLERLERERLCHQGRLVLAEQREQALPKLRRKESAEPPIVTTKETSDDYLQFIYDLPLPLRYGLILSLIPLLLVAASWFSTEETIVAEEVQKSRTKSKLKRVKIMTTRQRRHVDDYVLNLQGPTKEQEFHLRWALLAQWRRTFPVHERDEYLNFGTLKSARISFGKNKADGCSELDGIIRFVKRNIETHSAEAKSAKREG